MKKKIILLFLFFTIKGISQNQSISIIQNGNLIIETGITFIDKDKKYDYLNVYGKSNNNRLRSFSKRENTEFGLDYPWYEYSIFGYDDKSNLYQFSIKEKTIYLKKYKLKGEFLFAKKLDIKLTVDDNFDKLFTILDDGFMISDKENNKAVKFDEDGNRVQEVNFENSYKSLSIKKNKSKFIFADYKVSSEGKADINFYVSEKKKFSFEKKTSLQLDKVYEIIDFAFDKNGNCYVIYTSDASKKLEVVYSKFNDKLELISSYSIYSDNSLTVLSTLLRDDYKPFIVFSVDSFSSDYHSNRVANEIFIAKIDLEMPIGEIQILDKYKFKSNILGVNSHNSYARPIFRFEKFDKTHIGPLDINYSEDECTTELYSIQQIKNVYVKKNR